MAEKRSVKELTDILRELVERKGIDLERIVVFGSRAKGIYREDSDIDIIVVSKAFENKDIFERVGMTSGIHRELVRKIMMPVDIVYLSVSEWESGDSLIVHYAKEGEEAYARGKD
ncbi:MAG: nucleotidyltransferase domain-containing protein [Dehalococcoidia bacterium]